MKPQAGATRALVLEGFGSRLSFGLLTFALPLYGRELGLSLTEIGVLASTSVGVSLLLKPVLGPWADRWGLRRSLLWALALRALLCAGYAVAWLPWQLFAIRSAHGATDALRDPAVHALIAANGGKKKMAATFAWYQTAKTTAGSVGKSLAGVLLATAGGFGLTFAVAFGLALLPLLLVWWLVPRTESVAAAAPEPRTEPEPVAPAATGLGWYAGLGFAISGTSAMLSTLFPILATEYAGLSTAQAGLLYLVTPIFAFTGPLWGWLSDRVSRSLVLSFRSVANVGSAVLYLVAPNLAGIWVGRTLDDLGKAAFRPAWGSLMAEIAERDPRTRARTMAYLTSGEDAGALVAPIVAGLIWSGWGVPVLLLSRIGAALVTEVFVVVLERRQRRPRTAGKRRRPVPV